MNVKLLILIFIFISSGGFVVSKVTVQKQPEVQKKNCKQLKKIIEAICVHPLRFHFNDVLQTLPCHIFNPCSCWLKKP